jgi:2-hydroxy-3-keto-5-methylthiopentenyl-1-phosphate phosphatase
MSGWKILCDFDGTVVANDVTDCLLEGFAGAAWRAIERDWELGRIGSRECMQRQIALLEAAPPALDKAVAQMVPDPGFAGFVALARDLEIPLTIVSDGLDRVIRDILRRIKLVDIEIKSSRFAYLGDGRWRLEFPHARPDCQSAACTCKCAVAREDGRRTLLIGDGRSDFCVAQAADFVFAKHKLLDHCRDRGIPHAAFGDFTEAQALLKRLVAREHAALEVAEQVAHG